MQAASRRISIALFLILIVPMLVACGGDTATQAPTAPANTGLTATSVAQASPATSATPLASAVSDEVIDDPRNLTPDELLMYRPNELGDIPIFMYHNIVTDPSLEGHLYRTADELYADLQWLYDNNFYLVGMNAVVRGQFDVPAGKHPAVLTFDDSSSMHISFELGPDGEPLLDENGEYILTPNTAVEVMERFAADHPDFGVTAHFAIIPAFGFSWPGWNQEGLFEAKVQWLVDNGYEVGNHTSDHPELSKLDTSNFARNIAEPYIAVNNVVDSSHPNFAMHILTLPYGDFEEGGWTGDKHAYIVNGFVWNQTEVKLEGILLVCCGANPSPFHDDYRRLWISRIRGDDPDFAELQKSIENGWITLYTSDGNPETVTVPWPLPEHQWGKLNEAAITSRGLTLIKYNPNSGKIYTALGPRDRQAYNYIECAHVSA